MHTDKMDLVIDVGNNRTKIGLFGSSGIIKQERVATGDFRAVLDLLAGSEPTAVAIGSTAKVDPDLVEAMGKLAPVLVLDGNSASPLLNGYGTPATLGADRLANATAAAMRFPQRTVLVIDAGTCITYDLVNADGTYAGGAISPGMEMRAMAMHAYSARLPKVEVSGVVAELGTTTRTSLEAGIQFGILGEMHEFIRRYGYESAAMVVVLTGGDGPRFANALENGIFAIPFLTLEGYHALLQHHRSLHGGILASGAGIGPRPSAAG